MAYIAATILFILALGGLSKQESARRGNVLGMIGMGIALLVTIVGLVTRNFELLIGTMVIGGLIGFTLAKKVEMTQMPEPPLEVPVPNPPAITEIKFLFMARHIMYERIAPELPTNAPITMSKSLESINPRAAAAHPE